MEGKTCVGGWGPACRKVSAALVLTGKGWVQTCWIQLCLPLCLYKLCLLQPFRNIGQGWLFFYPEVPEHLRLKILFCLLRPLFLLHSLSLLGIQLLIAVSCMCPSLPSEKHLLGCSEHHYTTGMGKGVGCGGGKWLCGWSASASRRRVKEGEHGLLQCVH